MPESAHKRIAIVTNEVLGVVRTGGSGTANTFLSFALAREGHSVELLVTSPSGRATLDPAWQERYAARGISVRLLEPPPSDVAPGSFALAIGVLESLEHDPPDVAIVDAWAGTAYPALRLRHLGLGLTETTFVVICNGTTAWNYETDRKLPRSFPAFELEALERGAVELADAIVVPSRYLKDWLEGRGWSFPRTFVAPYFTQASVDGKPEPASVGDRLRRIAFFGRLEERKGVGPFVAALNRLDPHLLSGVEVAFVGRETAQWPLAEIEGRLSGEVKAATRLRFETDLDQPEAIAFLKEAGTVAVMPSLLDNSPNVVYECLDHGIPFVAARVGGIPELVATEDHDRVLVAPTSDAIASALERLLTDASQVRPVRAEFESIDRLAAWRDAIATAPPLARAASAASDEFVLLANEGDELDASCEETLRRAQAAAGADVVTCAVRRGGKRTYFFGEPHELGLVGNYYGLVALYRRSVLDAVRPVDTGGDTDWVRLATLSRTGASIVSVPRPLATTRRTPGNPRDDPFGSGASLAVARIFERECPRELRELPRLAASLAARRTSGESAASLPTRLRWIWEHEGAAGLVRRVSARSRLRTGAKSDDGNRTPRGTGGDT